MDTTNNIIERAIAKAMELHSGQTRKGGGDIPYAAHALEVGIIVARYTHSPEMVAAAILHDVLEESDYTAEELSEEFGEDVKNWVVLLTEDARIKDWGERKQENINRLRQDNDVYFIKSADALANMRSLVAALYAEGSVVWSRFNAPKDMKMRQFAVILNDTENFLPKKHLEEYVSILKDLEYSDLVQKSTLGFSDKN